MEKDKCTDCRHYPGDNSKEFPNVCDKCCWQGVLKHTLFEKAVKGE